VAVKLIGSVSAAFFSHVTRTRLAIFAIALVVALPASVSAQETELGPPPEAPKRAQDQPWPRWARPSEATSPAWLNTADRAAVRNSYFNVYLAAANRSLAWTGNTGTCNAGTTAQDYRNAAAQRLNWFRSMAGVPVGVSLDPTYSAKDQQAALMFSINRQLSHSPPTSWTCYTAQGAEAAGNSNICYSTGATYLEFDPGCVNLYMLDSGASNTAVGHRRWILYPQTQTMGTGDVPGNGTYYSANALWVFDGNYGGSRPATRDSFVAWPPKGFVPAPVVYARWSFSYPGASFTAATISMHCNGSNLALQQLAVHDGYGENTIVWEPSACSMPAGADAVATVTVSNVVIGGLPQTFSYTVRIFDPNTLVTDRLGCFRGGMWLLDANGNGGWDGPSIDRLAWLGQTGDTPVTGDWNGDGKTEAGLFRAGMWLLDFNGNGVWDGPLIDRLYWLGQAGDIPLVGDWNGDGRAEIGVFRAGMWLLDYNGSGGWDGPSTDRLYWLGQAGDTPLAGDWNGDNKIEIGLFRAGMWLLDFNGNGSWDGPSSDRLYWLGQAGDTPLVGDWGGNGSDGIGLFRAGMWLLDYNGNGAWDGPASDRLYWLGQAGDTPLVSDWNGDGKTETGFFRAGMWLLDYSGNGGWDGPSTDRLYWLGQAGDTPIVGRW
jgi:hypothetical protein